MTDIVERLHSSVTEGWLLTDHDALTAIAEIERLRANNKMLAARVKQLHDLLDQGNKDLFIPPPETRK